MARKLVWGEVSRFAPMWRHFWMRDPDLHVLACTSEDGGSAKVTHLVVAGDDLRSADIAGIPMGQILELLASEPAENSVEAPERLAGEVTVSERQRRLAEAIDSETAAPGDDLEVAVGRIYRKADRAFLVDALNMIAFLLPRMPKRSEAWDVPRDRPRLVKPKVGSGYDPEAFYEQVARAYRDYLLQTSRVAPRIASEAGVAVTTAHRWIREARRRGLLEGRRKTG